jgi:hypothetical protein
MPYLNSDAIQAGLIPCETNPRTGALSRTLEPFHAKATETVGTGNDRRRHVCIECAEKHHRGLKRRRGAIVWK